MLPHEREFAQPIEVDLTVWLSASSTARDGADAVIDYRELYDVVVGVVENGERRYLEDLAGTIAGDVLQRQRVDRVRAAVRKPHVSLPGPLRHAEVVVEMDRS